MYLCYDDLPHFFEYFSTKAFIRTTMPSGD